MKLAPGKLCRAALLALLASTSWLDARGVDSPTGAPPRAEGGEPRAAHLEIERRRGRVRLSGAVPDRDYVDRLLSALSLAFGVDEVDNRLEIDPLIERDRRLDGVLRVVFPLAVTCWFELGVEADRVVVEGEVRDGVELEIVGEQLRRSFRGVPRVVNLVRERSC